MVGLWREDVSQCDGRVVPPQQESEVTSSWLHVGGNRLAPNPVSGICLFHECKLDLDVDSATINTD